jgi:hypothetical protein
MTHSVSHLSDDIWSLVGTRLSSVEKRMCIETCKEMRLIHLADENDCFVCLGYGDVERLRRDMRRYSYWLYRYVPNLKGIELEFIGKNAKQPAECYEYVNWTCGDFTLPSKIAITIVLVEMEASQFTAEMIDVIRDVIPNSFISNIVMVDSWLDPEIMEDTEYNYEMRITNEMHLEKLKQAAVVPKVARFIVKCLQQSSIDLTLVDPAKASYVQITTGSYNGIFDPHKVTCLIILSNGGDCGLNRHPLELLDPRLPMDKLASMIWMGSSVNLYAFERTLRYIPPHVVVSLQVCSYEAFNAVTACQKVVTAPVQLITLGGVDNSESFVVACMLHHLFVKWGGPRVRPISYDDNLVFKCIPEDKMLDRLGQPYTLESAFGELSPTRQLHEWGFVEKWISCCHCV